MTRNSTSTMGALHPVIFFVLVYAISLFMAFFVCRVIYFAINGNNEIVTTSTKSNSLSYAGSGATPATALR